MIIKSEKLKCQGKEELERNKRDGSGTFKTKNVYFTDRDGLTITFSFCNDIVYNKAQKEKEFILKFYIDMYGKCTLNDIEG